MQARKEEQKKKIKKCPPSAKNSSTTTAKISSVTLTNTVNPGRDKVEVVEKVEVAEYENFGGRGRQKVEIIKEKLKLRLKAVHSSSQGKRNLRCTNTRTTKTAERQAACCLAGKLSSYACINNVTLVVL
ncbi:hypothetical protein Dimus_004686 [Dionaea muscipula]